MEDLFGQSLFFIFLFAVISVINYEKLDSKQKVSIIYILTFGMELNYIQIHKNVMMLYVSLLCAVFLFEEYWGDDEYKHKIIRRLDHKLVDFVYQFAFIYKGSLFSISYFLLANMDNNSFLKYSAWIKVVSVLTLFIAIHSIFANPIEHFTYTEIMHKINRYPYYKMNEDEERFDDYEKRMRMIVDIEDRFFFLRKSYTIMSWGYIKQYLTLIEQNTKTARNFQFKYFLVEWNKTKTIRIKIELIKKGIRFVRMWIGYKCNIFYVKCVNIIKRLFRRGHSTIEMQLFRTLSYKSGIKVGKPGNTKEIFNR